ncbi:hypothetical protein TNCV_161591 [Trichonephila clavipes]|nr:hypothetical protein TNCV_161591 [Trichonephila clavipes]
MSSFLVLSDGDTRNRWRDGQVCPDVGQGTMAPWTRRPGEKKKKRRREREREREEEKERREETEKKGRRRKKREGKESGEREEPRLVWRKGLSPEIGVKRR